MDSLCRHCQSPIDDVTAPAGYCCRGCATVAALLGAGGLERYYRLQDGRSAPVVLPARRREMDWLNAPLAHAVTNAGHELAQLHLDIQGIRCTACVWLVREVFMRHAGAVDAIINPAVGRVLLTFQPGVTDVRAALVDIERFGYALGPLKKTQSGASDSVLTRLGICVALTMNTMMFTFAHYLGLNVDDGEVFVLLRWLNAALSLAVLIIGGWEFFQRSLHGLRNGRLSFDLPISVGLLLGFAGSTWTLLRDPTTFSYFDTLNTFTTLMLVGRWLQERVLDQNRRQLLADDGVDGLFARRIQGGAVHTVPASMLREDDELLVPPGNLLVCDAVLLDAHGSFSLDWINGESLPREFSSGGAISAGAFNASSSAARVRLTADFADSTLLPLLSRHTALPDSDSRDGILLDRLARLYVPIVLSLAWVAFFLWLPTDLDAAIRIATSVLVVTCPCALGLAIPLAYQRMAAALRKRGVFVCRNGFLDRALRVRRVVFDKTGTLTLGTLKLANKEVLTSLDDETQRLVFNLTSRSSHPRSRCVHDAIPAQNAVFDPDLVVTEHAGLGLECLVDGHRVRLGAALWAAPNAFSTSRANDLTLSLDGEVAAHFLLEEQLRWDARTELRALADENLTLNILSGDGSDRVATIARDLGLPPDSAVGMLTPEGKAQWLRGHHADEDTLFIGDGLNDHPAFGAVLACGTPALDHPAMAQRVDFYFVTAGVGSVRLALHAAKRLDHVVKTIRAVALTYNVLSVAACIAGLTSPLLAAVAMPASSICILLYTVRGTRAALDLNEESTSLKDAAPAAQPT